MAEIDASTHAAQVVAKLRAGFRAGLMRWPSARIEQLKKLAACVEHHHDDLCRALYKDLRKPVAESKITELSMVFTEIQLQIDNVRKWVKPTSVSNPSHLMYPLDSMKLVPEPYGVALIISPWNYPVQLSLVALAGALAAGNTVVLKPSELAPATSDLLASILPQYLDERIVAVFTGGVPETNELLEQRFDTIMFTGSTTVGSLIMAKAARHLTPVTLELGGKSPTIVDSSCDLRVAARRIAWGKFLNAGQSCIAPDYVMVHESITDAFVTELRRVIEEMFGTDPQSSASFGRIINERHLHRIEALLQEVQVVHGGRIDAADLYVEPTIVLNPPADSALMRDEIFGPILPLIPYHELAQAIDFINDRPKPLACYMFSEDKLAVQQVETETSSGAFMSNDTMVHASMHTLPFGGVGPSGIGGYHGRWSFLAFSHMKPVVHKYGSLELGKLLWVMGYPKNLVHTDPHILQVEAEAEEPSAAAATDTSAAGGADTSSEHAPEAPL